jgi:hypothetical protein
MDGNGNSENKPGELNADQLILTRDRVTGAVSIGGNVQDLDLILDMLGRVTRHMDVQFRITAAVQAQEQIKQRQAEMQRVQSILRR